MGSDCGDTLTVRTSFTECPQVSYPYPPRKRAPAIMSNNLSEIGEPFISLPLTLPPHLEGAEIVTIEFGTGPQVLYFLLMVPTTCSDCWKKASRDCPAPLFPSQNLTWPFVPHPKPTFRAASGNYLAEYNPNLPLTWLSLAWPPQRTLAPLGSQTLQGPLNDTPFSP